MALHSCIHIEIIYLLSKRRCRTCSSLQFSQIKQSIMRLKLLYSVSPSKQKQYIRITQSFFASGCHIFPFQMSKKSLVIYTCLKFAWKVNHDQNIVAAFPGMHVSPAKHSYAWLPRKCNYRTDTHTHRQKPDKVIPMWRYASQATQKWDRHIDIWYRGKCGHDT